MLCSDLIVIIRRQDTIEFIKMSEYCNFEFYSVADEVNNVIYISLHILETVSFAK